ncbi:hypothetical protein AAVH_41986 [Aphelenchoides avenae]|nr:hypothetical protein AAVH_41986 [Aphelenchus avenae]
MAATAPTPANVTKRRQPHSSQATFSRTSLSAGPVLPHAGSELKDAIDSTISTANNYLNSGDTSNPLYALIASLSKLLGVLAQNTVPTPSIAAEDLERERSIVIAGIPESPDAKPSVRRKHDADQLTHILDAIDSEAAPVTHYLMGRTDPNAETPKPRLLKVMFASRQHQREVLSIFSKLARDNKDNDSFQFKHIYVRRSLTAAERDADKQLRDGAKRRRDAGDKCWVYAGRIVSARVPGRASTYNGQPQGNAV